MSQLTRQRKVVRLTLLAVLAVVAALGAGMLNHPDTAEACDHWC